MSRGRRVGLHREAGGPREIARVHVQLAAAFPEVTPIMNPEPEIYILLVDDRPDGLMALDAVLASPEYHLIHARSGQDALSHLVFHEFAAILLDVQMPQMDGFQTATLIKEKPQWKD